ncbi:hypothetical protein PV327_010590 [Microctonus hyperodae]|uniref:MYND-type domain-containing protein n=1 Tax=Microctonus hyperodae TaxID=165561 RepID=A0AA39FS89_MICHY|nr:hypothetical protein PV327_010590 [Microctonus hyperodae]
MIDSTQNNNGTNGLATALRDRSSCTIPVQPNRSLPVRPAPHIQCRSILSKKKSKKFETQQISDKTLTNDTQAPIISGSLTELSSVNTDLPQQTLSSSPSSSSSSSSPPSSSSLSSSSSSSPLLSSRLTNHNLIRINVPNWQNDIRLPIINIIEVSSNKKNNNNSNNKNTGLLLGRLSTNRKSNADIIDNKNYDNNSNNCSIIDITKSPERCVDFSINIDSSESNCSKNESIILDDDDNDDELDKNINTPPKKRRRRKEKKSTNNNLSPIKIVPPLRLKKIQCLQENNTTDSIISKESKESNSDIGFRYYQSNFTPSEQIIQDNIQSPADDWSNEYRIVSGQTPQYTVDINKQSSINSELNDKKLCYHQHKLQVKLRELKKKTFMLGREMIKNAFTSPNNSMQETIDSYKKQIETLNNLLEKLPQTGINNNISIQIPELPSTIVSSSVSTCTPTSISPYCDSSQSPGPPKLSPKIMIDTKTVKSPSKIRNSPPLLPKININIDNNSNRWAQSDFSMHTSEDNYDNLSAVGVTTTTAAAAAVTNREYIITEEIDIDDKPELLNLALNEIIKCDTNKNVEIMENDEVNQLKGNENMTNTTSSYANSDEIIINEANNNVIEELTNQQNERITSPKITSSCDTLQNNSNNQSIIINDNAISPIKALENHLRIDSHFPSLRSWLSNSLSAKNMKNLTKYNSDEKNKNNLITNPENQLPVIQFNVNQNINQAHKTNNPTINPRNTNIPEQNINVNGSQWNDNNNLQWQDQARRQTQILKNSLPNATDNPMGSSQFCQPMPIPSLYTRNYSMDSCGPYTYSHPAIAATANAATNNPSLWNNGIIEYPQIHTQNISNIQTRVKTPFNNNIQQQQQQQQHNIPTSSNNSVSLQQNTASPSIYRHYSSPVQSQNEITKTISINNDPTNSNIPLNNSFTKRNDYLSQSQLHSVLFSTSSNTAANVNQRLHPLSTQDNFYRYYQPQAYLQRQPPPQSIRYTERYSDPTNRLAIHDRSMPQMNYRPPWRSSIPSSPAFIPGNNYGIRSSWPLDPCNLLSTLSPVALQNYTTPLDVGLPINMRGTKERVSQTRNCDTPHLGKVEYNPNTTRKLECSNCGRPNPTFKCLGCEMTFYCDESCQARHWNRHVVGCPKKMPKLKKVLL